MSDPPAPPALSHHEILELAVEAAVHPRTIERLYRGEPIRSTTAARITRAADSLELQLPPFRIVGMARPHVHRARRRRR